MSVRTKVNEAVKLFIRSQNRRPTKVHVSPEIEEAMYDLTVDEVGDTVFATITTAGVRAAFKDGFRGLQVLWDADEFKVE